MTRSLPMLRRPHVRNSWGKRLIGLMKNIDENEEVHSARKQPAAEIRKQDGRETQRTSDFKKTVLLLLVTLMLSAVFLVLVMSFIKSREHAMFEVWSLSFLEMVIWEGVLYDELM